MIHTVWIESSTEIVSIVPHSSPGLDMILCLSQVVSNEFQYKIITRTLSTTYNAIYLFP